MTRQKSQKEPLTKEDFKFPLTYEELMEKRLIIKMFEAGKLGRIPAITGEVVLDLGEVDPSAEVEVWADIEPKKQVSFSGRTYSPNQK